MMNERTPKGNTSEGDLEPGIKNALVNDLEERSVISPESINSTETRQGAAPTAQIEGRPAEENGNSEEMQRFLDYFSIPANFNTMTRNLSDVGMQLFKKMRVALRYQEEDDISDQELSRRRIEFLRQVAGRKEMFSHEWNNVQEAIRARAAQVAVGDLTSEAAAKANDKDWAYLQNKVGSRRTN